jgi:hypothetical protein
MSEALDHLAGRVTADPTFLAHPLAAYARSEGLDDSALAGRLGLNVADLSRLRLCRAPRPEPADFRADLTAVATRFGIEPTTLMAVVRHGQGVTTLQEAPPPAATPGFMLAARDRDPPADSKDSP